MCVWGANKNTAKETAPLAEKSKKQNKGSEVMAIYRRVGGFGT